MPNKHRYFCPIRGSVVSSSKEEEFVIECIKYLIEYKNVPSKYIAVHETLKRFGAGGRNSLKPDILVFDRPATEAISNGKIDSDNVRFVAEIKVSSKDKETAIENQLIPAMSFCENVEWGIYWDEATRLAVKKDGSEFSIAHLPKFDDNKSSRLTKDDLAPLDRGFAVWEILDQTLRNHQGGAKKQLYKEVFKLLISKYYDENKNSPLEFCVRSGKDHAFFDRISKLYETAKKHYRLNGEFKDIVASGIGLREAALKACVALLEGYSLIDTDRVIIQEFYMGFAPEVLQKDLQQYYTPKEIISFMTDNVKITKKTTAIDPCSGSGDFMVGLLRKAGRLGIKADIENDLHCWDIDSNAAALAQINMILNGDGRSNVKVLDSLDEFNKDNEYYEFVITNPPFGKKTKYEGKNKIHYDINSLHTGKLFIERGLNLLKKEGILISVVPNGYIDNPSDKQFREVIFNRARVLGCVNLPDNVFKASGAGGATSILFIQNTPPPNNYKIFVAVADSVGFDCSRKATPPLIKRREKDGAYIRDENNEPVIDNDLLEISEQLKSFAGDENIKKFDIPDQHQKYNTVSLSTIKNNGFIINAKLYDKKTGYIATVRKIKRETHFTLKEKGITVSNNDILNFNDEQEYKYIETRSAYKDTIVLPPPLRGWALPDRAKQRLNTGDIFFAKMRGSESNFFYTYEAYSGFIASNGFYKVRIADEIKLLSFYRFLFTKEFSIQARALATGAIMPDIKLEDLLNGLYIPILDRSGLEQMRNFIKSKTEFIKVGII